MTDMRQGFAHSLATVMAWLQGVYFVAFGLWPLFDIRSFQAVTGEKTDHLVTGREGDHWLVNTVGALIVCIGLSLVVAAYRRRVEWEVLLLGLTSAVALATIDILYVQRQTIAPIYLADAAVEIAFLVGWLMLIVHRRMHGG
jgi:hypothetical protein